MSAPNPRMNYATFTRKFSAAHRLPHDPSPCQRIHGHNYVAEILVAVERLNDGMVVHAERVKREVDEKYDHTLILSFSDECRTWLPVEWVTLVSAVPTTEVLARKIATDVSDLILVGQGHGYCEVTLHETDTIKAHARVEW